MPGGGGRSGCRFVGARGAVGPVLGKGFDVKLAGFGIGGSFLLWGMLLLAAVPGRSGAGEAGNWPAFRGAGASGVQDGVNLPAHWDAETREGIRFRVAIPGLGHSSPIVWGSGCCHDGGEQRSGGQFQAGIVRLRGSIQRPLGA